MNRHNMEYSKKLPRKVFLVFFPFLLFFYFAFIFVICFFFFFSFFSVFLSQPRILAGNSGKLQKSIKMGDSFKFKLSI